MGFQDAAPLMAMALSEAGFPCRVKEVTNSKGRQVLRVGDFTRGKPPQDVLRRALTICGVEDVDRIAWFAHDGRRRKAFPARALPEGGEG